VRFPKSDQRVAVIGRTGSGKTVFAVFLLSSTSFMPWHRVPVFIFDFKGDRLIDKLPTINFRLGDKLPKKPGLYRVKPLPGQEAQVEALLWSIYLHEDMGIYIDEGYMLKDSKAFLACLTQGRSKHIPMLVLSQRPVRMNIAVFSEADFFSIFHLTYSEDRKRVIEYIGDDNKQLVNEKLPRYHSLWYDVGEDELTPLRPCPSEKDILERFRSVSGNNIKRKVAV
jgi:hypothetical protein